jgi:hypothetical protein
MDRWSWVVFVCWEWVCGRRQKRRAAKRLAAIEKRQTSEKYVVERQREFEQRTREDLEAGQPYAVRGCAAHVYRYLMREWFDRLADQCRYDEPKLKRLRKDWLDYMEALQASKASSYLSVELGHWTEREKYDLQAQEEKARLVAIENAFAEAAGPQAVEKLRGIRAMKWDSFSDEGEIAPKGHRYSGLGWRGDLDQLLPR